MDRMLVDMNDALRGFLADERDGEEGEERMRFQDVAVFAGDSVWGAGCVSGTGSAFVGMQSRDEGQWRACLS